MSTEEPVKAGKNKFPRVQAPNRFRGIAFIFSGGGGRFNVLVMGINKSTEGTENAEDMEKLRLRGGIQ